MKQIKSRIEIETREEKITLIISIVVLLLLIILSAKEALHLFSVKGGDYRYSIVEIKEEYYKGEVIGKTIEYSFKGKIYMNLCASQLCKRAKVGEKYFIRVFVEDPDIFEVVESRYDANKIKEIPYEGWGEIPATKF